MFDTLRAYIKALIERETELNAYFISAPSNSVYPYCTFDLTEQYSEDIEKHIFELIIDTWDKDSPKKCIKNIDKLDKKLKIFKDNTDDFVVCIFCGSSKQFIEDQDKTIVRLQRKYDIIVYSKKGE